MLFRQEIKVQLFREVEGIEMFKGATPQFAHLSEKFRLKFSSSSFAIRINLLHPQPFLLIYGLLLPIWCFSILVNYYFQVSSTSM